MTEAACALQLTFEHVRCFTDTERSLQRNHVLFASHERLRSGSDLTRAAYLPRSGMDDAEDGVVRDFGNREVKLAEHNATACREMLFTRGVDVTRVGRGTAKHEREGSWIARAREQLSAWWHRVREEHTEAVSHWITMRRQFPAEFWTSTM